MSNLSDYKLTISTNDDLSLTGSITANNITVSNNLIVQGTTTTVNQTSTLCTWVHSGTAVSAPTGNYIAITPSTF
jgi:hypothetical protein